MQQKTLSLLIFITFLFLLTGCWDRRELNDRLFELGSGVDRLENGKLLLAGQFMLPIKSSESKGGSDKSYFIETGTGSTVSDSLFDLQLKLSRRITRGHRHNIYIGEKTAREGISKLVDSTTRDPDSRLKSDIWIVKGSTALEFMQVSYPLEKMPVIALSKLRRIIGKRTENSLVELLVEQNAEGSGPTLPAVEIYNDPKLKKKTVRIFGRAVLNHKQQLVGYYDRMESAYRLWIIHQTDRMQVMTSNRNGSYSVNIQQPTSRIHTELEKGQVEIDIEVKGNATILETTESINLQNIENLQKYEAELNHHVETAILEMIQKAQNQFKVDVFHFGKVFSRQHPKSWRNLHSHWEQEFLKAKITVHSHVRIKRIGLHGAPLTKEYP